MFGVLLGEKGVGCRNAPVDAQRVIHDADATICLRVIELVTLVLEHCRLTQHGKAVGEAFGDEELQADG